MQGKLLIGLRVFVFEKKSMVWLGAYEETRRRLASASFRAMERVGVAEALLSSISLCLH